MRTLVEKIVERDAKGQITKVIEQDPTVPSSDLEAAAASAALRCFEVMAAPEVLARTDVVRVTISGVDAAAAELAKTRMEQSPLLSLIRHAARWEAFDVAIRPSSAVAAVAKAAPAASPKPHVGFEIR